MGHGKIELGGLILPTGLSVTHVNKESLQSRLNMKKRIDKLVRGLEVMGKVLASFPLFSA